MREFLAEQLQAQGIRIHFGAKPVEIEKRGEDQLTLKTEQGDTWQGSHVMFATGRRPNIKGLGLEEAGVDVDDKTAIKVDEYSRTSVDNIWAVGDVTDRINLTPVALMEGMAFAKTAFRDEPTKPDHTNVPSAGGAACSKCRTLSETRTLMNEMTAIPLNKNCNLLKTHEVQGGG